ncbi:LemA family protein [Tissierella sp.]|uniref:LemA family protein n=1 Tax=Tissierella sp. TaxID=41274 RepID=UPI0028667452|nr:LemA family protein [Tissierella sp.]MDR7857021.1 LemA family protein [Tissierella sp.]
MGIGSYNNLVSLDEEINNAWAQVENQLKRRADLIPNLVETVKGYAAHETEVIDSITAARAQYANASTPEEYAQADAGLTNAIKSLNVIVENYPDLKANQNFADLQVELAGTENRIATERMRYNETVKKYNGKIRKLPTNIWAGLLGFEKAQYFEINEQDAELPKVNF